MIVLGLSGSAIYCVASGANKTHFHKKGCALGLILKVRVFRTRKWPIDSITQLLSLVSSIFVLEILAAETENGGIIEEDDAQLELQLALER